MFVDQKNQYCQNVYTVQGNLWIQCNPSQITNIINKKYITGKSTDVKGLVDA